MESMMRDKVRARKRNEEGRALMDAGDLDGAIRAFEEAVALDERLESAWFNLGLVHKSRRAWEEAARCNRVAAGLTRLDEGEPAWWNLGIAATALHDWVAAREAWQRYGIEIHPGDGPVEMDFGPAPIRIEPGKKPEVVWCRRIDPARAVVLNVPFPQSKHRCGDIILHDGVPNGERMVNGRSLAVFDEIERWEASPTPTLNAEVVCSNESDSHALTSLFHRSHLTAEDWNLKVSMLCEACSTGRPHAPLEVHDAPDTWTTNRTFGIAAELKPAGSLLEEWQKASPSTRLVRSLEVAL